MHPTDHVAPFLHQCWNCVEASGKEFGWLYLPLAVFPFCFLRRYSARYGKWILALMAPFGFVAVLMLIVLNPDSQMESKAGPFDARAFLSAPFLVLAIWVGYGLVLLGILLTNRWFSRHPSTRDPSDGHHSS